MPYHHTKHFIDHTKITVRIKIILIFLEFKIINIYTMYFYSSFYRLRKGVR